MELLESDFKSIISILEWSVREKEQDIELFMEDDKPHTANILMRQVEATELIIEKLYLTNLAL